MKIKELKEILDKYPDDLELNDITIPIDIAPHKKCNKVYTIYVGNYRVCGNKLIGNETIRTYETKLNDMAEIIKYNLPNKEKEYRKLKEMEFIFNDIDKNDIYET